MSTAAARKKRDAEWVDRFVQCRAGGHVWRYASAFTNWEAPNAWRWAQAFYAIHKRCDVRGSWKHIAVGRKGERLAYNYEYAEGYMRPKGQGHLDKDGLRLWEAENYGQRLRKVRGK